MGSWQPHRIYYVLSNYLNKWYSLGSKSEEQDTEKAFCQSAGLLFPFHKSFVLPEDPSSVEQLTREWDGHGLCLGRDGQSVPFAPLQMSWSFWLFSSSIQIEKGWRNIQHTLKALGAAEVERVMCRFLTRSSTVKYQRGTSMDTLVFTQPRRNRCWKMLALQTVCPQSSCH